MIKHNFNFDDELLNILSHSGLQLETKSINEDAIREIETYLTLQQAKFLPTSMSDILKRFQAIPYGWREIDIAAGIAEVIKVQIVQIKVAGNVISSLDKNIIGYLRKRSEVDRVLIEKRICISEETIRKARNILKEYLNEMDIPSKEDDLAKYIIDTFGMKLEKCVEYISFYSRANYPQKDVLEDSIKLYKEVLSRQKDNEQLFNSILHYENDLFDLQEDLEDLISFFVNQVNVYDKALAKIKDLNDEKTYLDSSLEAKKSFENIQNILSMSRPYSRLREIPNYIQEIDKVYDVLLANKKVEIIKIIENIKNKLSNFKNQNNESKYDFYVNDLNNKIDSINYSKKLTILDAIKSNLSNYEINATKELISIKGYENSSKIAIVSKDEILNSKQINKNNLNDYLEEVREKLIKLLEDNDEINIL